MKRLVAAAIVASFLFVHAPVVRAYESESSNSTVDEANQYEDAFSNPLRLAYYMIYPVGFTIEWLVMRPLHYLVSRPYLAHFFGYTPIGEEGSYERMGEHM
jgi:hypothetical protein